jgi:hypothetical protein
MKKQILTAAVAAAMMLPASAVVAGEATWGLSGWVNEGITAYDDGDQSDIGQFSENGTTLGSRLTFTGTYKPDNTNLTAGFEVIMEPRSGTSPLLGASQATLDADDSHLGSGINALSHNIHIGGDWGKVTLGTQSMPTDNIAVLADPSVTIWSGISPVFRGNGFVINNGAGGTWGSFLTCLGFPGLGIGIDCNGVYRSGVRYDLPAMGNVNIAVGWANDEIYDIALKYAGELGGLKANFNAGYSYNANGGIVGAGIKLDGSETFQAQVGLMDPESGLFTAISYQAEEAETSVANTGDDTDAYYIKAGIKTAMNDMGDTAIYGEYGSYNDQFGDGRALGITGSEFERVGVVVEQYFGARLLVYGKYEQYSIDVEGTNAYDNADDLDLATVGVTIFF